MRYNPLARNFFRIRRLLMARYSLPRHAIKPSTKIAELVANAQPSREAEFLLRNRFLSSERPSPFGCLSGFVLGISICIGMAGSMGYWEIVASGFFVITIGYLMAYLGNYVPPDYHGLTVGDAALAMTTQADCRDAEYMFTHREVTRKVCMIVSDSLGVHIDQLRPETSFREDIGAD